MAKRFNQLQQLTAAQLARTDQIAIRDESAGQVKYITVQDLTGAPEFGWSSTGESWSFSSFSSTTKKGVVTVPTDATVKYSKGMRVRFAQTTGGTKYARVVAVTTTSLTLRFAKGITLNNEAITGPVYSSVFAPYGYDHTTIDTLKCGFLAYYGGINNDVSITGVVPFNTEVFDIGNDLTLGTGSYFTAPIDGLYQFNWMVYTNNNLGRAMIEVTRSGVSQWQQQTEAAGKTLALTYYCLAGDVVQIRGDATNGIKFYAAINHNGFSGGLIADYVA